MSERKKIIFACMLMLVLIVLLLLSRCSGFTNKEDEKRLLEITRSSRVMTDKERSSDQKSLPLHVSSSGPITVKSQGRVVAVKSQGRVMKEESSASGLRLSGRSQTMTSFVSDPLVKSNKKYTSISKVADVAPLSASLRGALATKQSRKVFKNTGLPRSQKALARNDRSGLLRRFTPRKDEILGVRNCICPKDRVSLDFVKKKNDIQFKNIYIYKPYIQPGGSHSFSKVDTSAAKVDLFAPAWQTSNQMVFSDFRGYFPSSSGYEANFHFGYRHLFPDKKMLYGLYFAFDRKRVKEIGAHFRRFVVGFEYWLNDWFVGANFYKPFGKTIVRRRLTNKNKYTVAMTGSDFEIGKEFTPRFTGYVGGYYFYADKVDSIYGPRVRATYDWSIDHGDKPLAIFDKVSLGCGLQYDKIRGTSFVVSLGARVGLLKQKPLSGVSRHMLDAIRRDVDIAFGSFEKNDSLKPVQKVPKVQQPPPPSSGQQPYLTQQPKIEVEIELPKQPQVKIEQTYLPEQPQIELKQQRRQIQQLQPYLIQQPKIEVEIELPKQPQVKMEQSYLPKQPKIEVEIELPKQPQVKMEQNYLPKQPKIEVEIELPKQPQVKMEQNYLPKQPKIEVEIELPKQPQVKMEQNYLPKQPKIERQFELPNQPHVKMEQNYLPKQPKIEVEIELPKQPQVKIEQTYLPEQPQIELKQQRRQIQQSQPYLIQQPKIEVEIELPKQPQVKTEQNYLPKQPKIEKQIELPKQPQVKMEQTYSPKQPQVKMEQIYSPKQPKIEKQIESPKLPQMEGAGQKRRQPPKPQLPKQSGTLEVLKDTGRVKLAFKKEVKQLDSSQEEYYIVRSIKGDEVSATVIIENGDDNIEGNSLYLIDSFRTDYDYCTVTTKKKGEYLITSDERECKLRFGIYLPEKGKLSQVVKIYDSNNVAATIYDGNNVPQEEIKVTVTIRDNDHPVVRHISSNDGYFYRANSALSSTFELGVTSYKDADYEGWGFVKENGVSKYIKEKDFGFSFDKKGCGSLKAGQECNIDVLFDYMVFKHVNGAKYLTSDKGLALYLTAVEKGTGSSIFWPLYIKFNDL